MNANPVLIAYLFLFAVSGLGELFIEFINSGYSAKFGDQPPEQFRGYIDRAELNKISSYSRDRSRFSIFHSTVSKTLFLLIILTGLLPWFRGLTKGLPYILSGVLFFAFPSVIMVCAGMPFDYYNRFVIEDRYGFNTATRTTWVMDQIKGALIVAVLGGGLLCLVLIILEYSGKNWWIWAWVLFFLFQLLVTVLYPTVIAPVFNKFTPVEDESLKKEVEGLAARQGIGLKGIFQMDASKRSRHTNAYLSGLGKAKRIVLFDSLISSHSVGEIAAVLAHEIGHLKKRHILKQLLISSLSTLVLFYAASLMIEWEGMYEAFGFSETSAYVGLFLVGVIWGPVGFFLSPISMALSRRFEREADEYGARAAGGPEMLSSSLKKMAKDNLADIRPHPLYVLFNYSHPSLLERVQHLEKIDK